MASVSAALNRWFQVLSLLRLTPFETQTAAGRSNERHRRMLLSAGASAAAKAISISAALISVPLTLHYLGAERYGMWLALSSVLAILSFADLGIGNGLLGQVAAAHGQDDIAAMRRAISSAFGILTLIAAGILIAFTIAYPFVPWRVVFNAVDPVAVQESGPAIAVFAACFALNIPAALVQKVQTGLQDSFITSLWQCAGSLLALAGIVIATRLQLGLPWLVLAFLGAPLMVAIANSLIFFLRQRPDIAPRLSAFSRSAAAKTVRVGLLFLVLQIVAAVSYASDPLIIAHILGPAAVPQYSVPERLFALVGMVVAMGLAPLWPAYGEAISRSDHAWVRATLFRSIGIAAIIASVGSILVGFFAPNLLDLWVGSAIQASPILIVGLALWKVLEAVGIAIAMFLNGSHVVQFQVVVALLTGAFILILKFIFVDRFGVSGSVWATIIGWTLFSLLPMSIVVIRMLRSPRVPD